MARTITAALLWLLVADAATAAVYDFRYFGPNGTVTGQVSGTLQSDGNTVVVTGVSRLHLVTFSFLAVTAEFDTFFSATDYVYAYIYNYPRNGNPPATLTLDGTRNDLIAFTSLSDNVAFIPGDLPIPGPGYFSYGSFGDVGGLYSPGDWSMQLASVPEPASWAMLIAGFGLVGAAMRRRAVRVPALL